MSSIRGIAGIALTLGIAMAASSADAQFIAAGAPPQYGTLAVRGRVAPDPTVVDGIAGGPVSLDNVSSDCRGYALAAPSHLVMVDRPMRYLALVVRSNADTTLLVQTSDGRIYCNDDTDGTQPRVEIAPPAGPIRVWVGTYSSGEQVPYRFGLTANPQVRSQSLGEPGAVAGAPTPAQAQIAAAARPLFGQAAIRQGMRPDPLVVTGSSGGPILASQVHGGCRGYISPAPSHRFVAQSGFTQLRFVVNAAHDTTLVVQMPDGRVLCDDDSGGGRNPSLMDGTGPGPINVWVGSYSANETGTYQLGLSQNAGLTPAMLGQGGPVVVTPPVVPPVTPVTPVTPPPGNPSSVVSLQRGIPITLLQPGVTEATLAVWSPRGGPQVMLGLTSSGQGLNVFATISGQQSSIVTIPSQMAQDATVTVTERSPQEIVVNAERPPGPRDQGTQMILRIRWDGRTRAAAVADQWIGTFGERVPRWAR